MSDAKNASGKSGSRRTRPLRGIGLTGACVALALAFAPSSARAQRVTVTIGGYPVVGAVPPQTTAPVAAGASTGASPSALAYGQAAWAGAAAYGRYMQYLSLLNYEATHGGALPPGSSNAREYFTNGAEATTVPLGGPGSGLVANGSDATGSPQAPPSGFASAPPAAPSTAGSASPWVVVVQSPTPPEPSPSPSASSPPAISPPAPLPSASSRPADRTTDDAEPVAAMSFDDWLRSMGYAEEEPPTLTSADVATIAAGDGTPEPPVLAEPAALAFEVRPRATTPLREKARGRADRGSEGGGSAAGFAAAFAAAFAAGLLLGGLAVLRLRDRWRREPALDAPPIR